MINLLEKYPPEKTGEPMVGIIESIVCDIPRTYIVNVLNKGNYVPGIPANFEIEVPAMVSKSGIQPIQTDGLPLELISFALRDRVAPVEVELAAYRQGRKELLLQLILMDPWTKSEAQAKALLEEILEQQWAAEMREHYQ
jgi:alpha-galactosidase